MSSEMKMKGSVKLNIKGPHTVSTVHIINSHKTYSQIYDKSQSISNKIFLKK